MPFAGPGTGTPSGRAPFDALAATVLARCEAVAACTEEPGAITRPFPSGAMRDAQSLLRSWMEAAGLDVRVDAVGNVVGRRAAPTDDAPVLLIGSHLDSVRNAGRYDGVLGVLAALATVEAIGPEPLPFHVDAIAFCDEEGLRFGSTYFGSLAVAGAFPDRLLEVRDAQGTSLGEALDRAGYGPDRIRDAAYDPARTLGFLELHIEQGPRLEELRTPLGIATAIAGQTKAHVRFRGRAAHAGTTPMHLRRDALAGAAAWIVAVERRAGRTPDLVATIGDVRAEPGALNVVAGAATCTLDVRHERDGVRVAAVGQIREAAADLGRQRGLNVEWETLVDEPSRPLDPAWIDRLRQLIGAPSLVSGAGHDAAVLSTFAPCALLFVRSPGGVSHHPEEAVARGDVAAAIEAMTAFVRSLAADAGADVA
jgi:allantoate deiminase